MTGINMSSPGDYPPADFSQQHLFEAGRRTARQQWAAERAKGLLAEVGAVQGALHAAQTTGLAGLETEADHAVLVRNVAASLRAAAERVEKLA